MFPKWTAEQLFAPYGGGMDFIPEPPITPEQRRPQTGARQAGAAVADIVAAFVNRSDYIHQLPPARLFDGAKDIRLVGLSLNVLCQNYPDRSLLRQLEAGTTVSCLFLDPDGDNIARREAEESEPPGHLSVLTRLNIDAIRRIKGKLSAEAQPNLRIRTYDEPVRFNITIVDDTTCVVQPYLPDARGLESPTLVLERRPQQPGLFDTFAQVFDTMWDRATEVTA